MNQLYVAAMVDDRRRKLSTEAARVRNVRAARATGQRRELRAIRWPMRPRLRVQVRGPRILPA